ncbi:RND family transporter [Paraburkholderia dipogonis]|uniref:RND family transporter n=2 Tax=Paraburkholderia dipogonis TaxID=1211383 RepID=A0A4Y8MKH3_9BURK|nr:RND family transporter [Paraburkholderia dipogonis]
MASFAVQLKMDAGFDKQMPLNHEYILTFKKYRNDLFGANRVTVVVRNRKGLIWTTSGLERLYRVTQAVAFLPGVDRGSVRSLWTPNTFVNEIDEEGFRAEPLISGTVTPNRLTARIISQIRTSTTNGGFDGVLVSRDGSSAMVTADINETNVQGGSLDYIDFNRLLEKKIRQPFEDSQYEIQIIGFAKQTGDIADGASAVVLFCAIALILTAVSVYWYCHSLRFTLLAIGCSLTSLVWQFGSLQLLGYGLDPLGVLVPFLVFAIGVSHGIQQINFIIREVSEGQTTLAASQHSFKGLLIPGTLALSTAFVSFITLLFVPIPVVRELAVTASIGVAFKIVTNLVMLPVAASYCAFSTQFAKAALAARERRSGWLRGIARVARPRNAFITVLLAVGLLGLSAWESRDRIVGTLQPGAPELRESSRFNRDAVSIASNYAVGLDWMSVVFEEPRPDACSNANVGLFEDDFTAQMQRVPGVVSTDSYAQMLKSYSEGYNEGYPKMSVVPLAADNYAALSAEINRSRGYMTKDCSMTAVHLYLSDHKASTINNVIAAVERYRHQNHLSNVSIRLAGGNIGVIAAANDAVSKAELPMMLYVYAAILVLVFLAYRDWRAMIACCAPLTVATFVGYWFMKEAQIGLTEATLPVMVLAVGIGVDYAFYIYNRLQLHLAAGDDIVTAVESSILEVGVATVFTALTLAAGVITWSFSSLKFQADMGQLMAFMFVVNAGMAMTVLPALVVTLERMFPRRKPVRVPGILIH